MPDAETSYEKLVSALLEAQRRLELQESGLCPNCEHISVEHYETDRLNSKLLAENSKLKGELSQLYSVLTTAEDNEPTGRPN